MAKEDKRGGFAKFINAITCGCFCRPPKPGPIRLQPRPILPEPKITKEEQARRTLRDRNPDHRVFNPGEEVPKKETVINPKALKSSLLIDDSSALRKQATVNGARQRS